LQKMLKGFLGVLVTDFYPPYNAISCSQQKCLVHLMRDMNQDILSNPFDIDLRFITDQFGRLLRAIVSTIDKHGLKRSHLQGHSTSVEMFLQSVAGHSFHSEVARALQNRIVKNRDKLFTFVDHDGIPWNNNNAEFAMRQFSYFRDDTAKFMKERGLSDYLVLLSVYQTCRYKGINFLKFLLSGVTNFEAFPTSKRNRRRNPVELYPRGFEPTHLARMHRLNESRRKQHAHQQASLM